MAKVRYERMTFDESGLCKFDCCFSSLTSGARTAGIFGICTGIFNLIIGIWAITTLVRLQAHLEPHMFYIYFCPGIIPIMAIELALEVGMIILSFGLLVGINRGNDGRVFIRAWMIGMVGFRIFDALYGVYILAWLGGYRVSDAVFVHPELIVIAIYWVLNTLYLIVCLRIVSKYWKEHLEKLFGKEMRKRHFQMLSNIRSAAGRRTGLSSRATPFRSGAMTPSNYSGFAGGPSRGMSQSTAPPSAAPSQQHFPSVHQGPVPGKY